MKKILIMLAVLVFLACGETAQATVDMNWVTVGDAGNVDDDTGYGGVNYRYHIGRFEVTNSQYCQFLNAIATTEDTYELYNTNMASGHQDTGGIMRSGSPGSYYYSCRPGREQHPVNYVSWYDALRFANWMHNGQPSGYQDVNTTEDGSYTLTGPNSVATGDHPIHGANGRNKNVKVWLTSENEWYKAAYYKGGSPDAGYWEYPTQSESCPISEPPPGDENSANYNGAVGNFTDVGAYQQSVSAYVTFDQGGNVWEWNEALISDDFHGMRGGSQGSVASACIRLAASYRDNGNPGENHHIGFRVAGVVEPARIYHVDGATGDNTNDGLTRETAFETIQYAIDEANDCETVLVWPGVYNETATHGINFKSKAITVKSAADAAVLEVPGFVAVTFVQGEDENSVFSNFVVRGSNIGIFALFANPTINNVTVVDNDNGIIADNANPLITNSIFWNNTNGDLFGSPDPITAQHSWLEGELDEPNMPLTGLVSHWKLDEGAGPIAYDSGGTNHGAVIDAMWTTGLFGNALDFDGVDDYVQVANDASLNIPVELTISAWVKADSLSGNPGIVFKGGAGNNQRYKLAFAEGQLFFERNTTDGYKKLRSPDVSATNVWLHVVGLYDGTYIKVYENGIEKNSVNVGSNIVSYLGYPLVVGINKFWNAYFDGIVDYVSIYDRALSAEEIEQIYQPMVSPMFADAAGGDYHLLSERGRYRATTDEWILDEVTSPCIDGGDPDVAPSNERTPNGGRINIGAYGNTAYASMSECWSKADINCDGIVNFKDFAIFSQEWLETTLVIPEPNVPDVTPPAPVPAIITIGAVSPSSIMMTASEAFDESGVQYYFEALSAGGHDSGWIGARTYTDAGLIPDTTYCYRVKARDTSHNYNETIWSAQVCALTIVLPDTLAPLPNPMQWDPVVDANGYDGLPREIFMSPYGAFDYGATMRAIDADDQAPVSVPVAEVEYYFECIDESGFNSGWRTVAAYPNELERRTYTVKLGATGQYLRFRVKARDASDNHNETDWSITYPVMVP